MGAIVRESQTSTNRNYEIDDGTGVIQVRIWIESDDSSDHIAKQLGNVGYASRSSFLHCCILRIWRLFPLLSSVGPYGNSVELAST